MKMITCNNEEAICPVCDEVQEEDYILEFEDWQQTHCDECGHLFMIQNMGATNQCTEILKELEEKE